jgi:hypothetical protein
MAVVLTWTGSVSTDWNNSANWTPQQVPTASDHVIMGTGSVVIPANAAFAIMDWSNNVLSGTLTVTSNAVLNIAAGSSYVELEGPLTNFGTINWSSGIWYIYNDGSSFTGAIYNQPGGLIDAQGDLMLEDISSSGGFLDNAGIFRKSAGTGTLQAYTIFTNTATVDVESGTLSLNEGGGIGGLFTTAAGTAITLSGGAFVPIGSPTFTGSGQSRFLGDSITLLNNTIPGLVLASGTVQLGPNFQGGSITNLTVSGATLAGTNTVTGTFNWLGGYLKFGASLTVSNNAVLNLEAGSSTVELEGPLTNYGTINWSSGSWYIYNDGSFYFGAIYNEPGGLIDAQGDLTLLNISASGGFLNNAGIFRKSAGTGILQAYTIFTNTATVDVESGTLSLNEGGGIGGLFNAATNAAITLHGGAFAEIGSPTFTGSGQSQFLGDSITLLNNVIPGLALAGGTVQLGPNFQGGSITNLTVSGATLAGTNTVTGMINWLGGFLMNGASLTVATNAVMNIAAGSSYMELRGPLTNYGTINWSSGIWYIYNDGSSFTGAIYNQPGGLINAQGDLLLEDISSSGGVLDNAGTFRKSAGTGILQVYTIFTNTATVDVESGTLSLNEGGGIGGLFTTAAGTAITLSGGAFVPIGSPTFTGSGQSQFLGNSITLLNNVSPGLALAGGIVQLGPNFQGGTITNLTMSGASLAGTNTVTGTINWLGGFLMNGASLTVANHAVMNIAAGSSAMELKGPLTNYGTINWSSGYWYIYNDGSLNTGAIYNQPGGVINAQGDLTLENISSSGGFLDNAGMFRKSAGTGILQVYSIITNTGTVEADQGTISFEEGYHDTSSGELVISLGGAAPGTGFGQIQFANPPAFQGSLGAVTRNGFEPTPGEIFTNALIYPSLTSAFPCLDLDLGGGFLLRPNFGSTSMSFTTATYTLSGGQPQILMTVSKSTVSLQWPPGFPGWTLQSKTNLLSPAWTAVPGSCGNTATVPNNGAYQFFRLVPP